MRGITPPVTLKWCHKVWSFRQQTGPTSCCCRATIRARQDMLTDDITHNTHTHVHYVNAWIHTYCTIVRGSDVHICKRVWVVLRKTYTLYMTSYLHVFNHHIPSWSSSFSHSPSSTNTLRATQCLSNFSTKPLCVHHSISHNDLTQVSIVANCDTLHCLSTALSLMGDWYKPYIT